MADDEIIVRLTAKVDELNAQLQSASAAVADAQKKMGASAEANAATWRDLAKAPAGKLS